MSSKPMTKENLLSWLKKVEDVIDELKKNPNNLNGIMETEHQTNERSITIHYKIHEAKI